MPKDKRQYYITTYPPLEWPEGMHPIWQVRYRNVDDVPVTSEISGDLLEVERVVAMIHEKKWNRNGMQVQVAWTGEYRKF